MKDFLNYMHRQADEAIINPDLYPELWGDYLYISDWAIEDLLENDKYCHGLDEVSPRQLNADHSMVIGVFRTTKWSTFQDAR
jgi:hypothetical protein